MPWPKITFSDNHQMRLGAAFLNAIQDWINTHTHDGNNGAKVKVQDLDGMPGGTTTFLRADGTFVAPNGGGESNTASNLGVAGDGAGLYDSKSGADLRFKRVKAGTGITITAETNDVQINAAGIAVDPAFTAKGDLITGTGSGAAAKTPLGTNGQVLVADSTQSTGVKWSPAPSGLPSMTGNAGKVLGTDGSNGIWQTPTGSSTGFIDGGNATSTYSIGQTVDCGGA